MYPLALPLFLALLLPFLSPSSSFPFSPPRPPPPSTHRIQLTAAAATYTCSSIQQHPHTAAAAYSSGSLPQPPPTPAAAVRCRRSLQQYQHTPTAVYSSSLPSLSSSDHPLTVLSPLPPIHAPLVGMTPPDHPPLPYFFHNYYI